MRSGIAFVFAVFVLCLAGRPVQAQRVLVVGNDGQYATIEAALAAAQDGDTIEVHGGVYGAPLNIEKSVSLIGVNGPVIDGQGTGTLVLIYAPDVLFQGFVIRNTGSNLSHEDSAIVIQAERVTVAENRLESVLFGIYFAAASHGIARDNVIYGKPEVSEGLRGDSIRVWYSDHVLLSGNQAYITRDVLIWYANFVSIENNIFARNRYGLHVMYSNDMTVTGNTFAESSVGCYLMYALRFTMTDNYVVNNRGPSGYGLALKDMDSVTVSHNVLAGNRAGLYLDNSPALYEGFNEFEFNLLAYNDIGVLALPAVARNIFQNNIFLDNVQQAGTEGRGNLQGNVWQEDGIGNYWSDYVGYDEDGDGIGDLAYRSERLSESLSDSYPVLRLFIYSPALQALDFVGAAFPSLRPDPKLIDEAPLMQYTLPGSSALPGTAPLFWGAALILCISGAAVYVFALRSSWSVRLRRLS